MGFKGRPSDWRICPCGNHLWHLNGYGIAQHKLIKGAIVHVKVERCKWHGQGQGEVDERLNEILSRTVDELPFSVRVANRLYLDNIEYVGELVQKTESQMLNTKNFGRMSLKEVKEILAEMGLSLGMKFDNWPRENQ
ncbi:hypothetical protein LCGC14_0761430 [marine sediment metagenome]|uniref:RNA polymerase alpha subunit C-terminal domain-containing protein n=1 Tax=marine sediment metagenome TaxID=412755 RepID=A0A0F9QKY0_9ZZZZ